MNPEVRSQNSEFRKESKANTGRHGFGFARELERDVVIELLVEVRFTIVVRIATISFA